MKPLPLRPYKVTQMFQPQLGRGIIARNQITQALFGNGEEGGLWLPGPDTCFTDIAGTINAGPGDIVAYVQDSNDNRYPITQATAAARPALGRTVEGGRRNELLNSDSGLLGSVALLPTANLPIRTLNAAPNPFGTANDAVLIEVGEGATVASFRMGNSKAAGDSYTCSVYFKVISAAETAAVAYGHAARAVQSQISVFDGTTINPVTSLITDIEVFHDAVGDDGWRRLSSAQTNESASTNEQQLNFYNASPGDQFLVWGVQSEEGLTRTEYQTVGTTALDVTEAGKPELWYLSFDGVDDFMNTPPLPSLNVANHMVGAAVMATTGSAASGDFWGNRSGSLGRVFRLPSTGTVLYANVGTPGVAGNVPDPTKFSILYGGSSEEGQQWLAINGGALVEADSVYTAGSDVYSLGKARSEFFAGMLTALAASETLPEVSKRAQLESFLAARSGVTVAEPTLMDRLFGDGRYGAMYLPGPDTCWTDVNRTTPAAVGDTVAFVDDVVQDLQLGPELVTNGTFDDGTGWSLGAAWSIAGGVLTATGLNSSGREAAQPSILTVGKVYEITLDVVSGDARTGNMIIRHTGNVVGNDIITITPDTVYPVTATVKFIASTTDLIIIYSAASGGQEPFSIDNISVRELKGYHLVQSAAASRPILQQDLDGNYYLQFDKVDDALTTTLPSQLVGRLVLATGEGTTNFGVDIPAGAYNINGPNPLYFPDANGIFYGAMLREGDFSGTEKDETLDYFIDRGAGVNYAGVANITSYLRDRQDIVSADLTRWDVSSATSIAAALNNLDNLENLNVSNWDVSDVTSFSSFLEESRGPLKTIDVSNWDTSSVTTFAAFAENSTNFTHLITEGGTGNPFADSLCTDYTKAFFNTNLTQESIDNILVRINAANTSNGTFGQSGGSAPSAVGEAAIDALRARGWTITVTGGY